MGGWKLRTLPGDWWNLCNCSCTCPVHVSIWIVNMGQMAWGLAGVMGEGTWMGSLDGYVGAGCHKLLILIVVTYVHLVLCMSCTSLGCKRGQVGMRTELGVMVVSEGKAGELLECFRAYNFSSWLMKLVYLLIWVVYLFGAVIRVQVGKSRSNGWLRA